MMYRLTTGLCSNDLFKNISVLSAPRHCRQTHRTIFGNDCLQTYEIFWRIWANLFQIIRYIICLSLKSFSRQCKCSSSSFLSFKVMSDECHISIELIYPITITFIPRERCAYIYSWANNGMPFHHNYVPRITIYVLSKNILIFAFQNCQVSIICTWIKNIFTWTYQSL